MATPYEMHLFKEAMNFSAQFPQYKDYGENIAMILEIDCKRNISYAFDVMSLTGEDKFNDQTFMLAARIVIKRVLKKRY